MFVQHRVTTVKDPDLRKQMTVKVGIKQFSEIAVRALETEFVLFDRVGISKLFDPVKTH